MEEPTESSFEVEYTRTELVIESEGGEKKSYKGLTGFWSKWGGARAGIATNQYGDAYVTDEWFCQSCTQPQPPELSPYRFEYPEGELIRVCASCFLDRCAKLKERINSL